MEKLNKYNKYLLLLFVALLSVVAILLILLSQKPMQKSQPLKQQLTTEDIASIDATVKNELSDKFKPDELALTHHTGNKTWAIAIVYSTTREIDPAFVLLKNIEGTWKVMYGPATDYDEGELLQMGAPKELIGQIYDAFNPQ